MTTLMLVFGMLPTELGQDPGALIAEVIVGGKGLLLPITLLIIPLAFSLFDDLAQRRPRGARPPTPALAS